MKKSPHLHFLQNVRARNMFSLFDPRPIWYFRHCEIFFGMKVVSNQQVSKKRGLKRRGLKRHGLNGTLSQINGLKWMVSN